MVPEGTLEGSQAPATCPYPEPDQSSPCLPCHFFKIDFNIILPYKCRRSKRFLCPSGLPTKTLNAPRLSPIHNFFYYRNNYFLTNIRYMFRPVWPSLGEAVKIVYSIRQHIYFMFSM